MRFLILIPMLCCLLLSTLSFAQYYPEKKAPTEDNSRSSLYKRKIESFNKMKKVGFTLASVGGGITVTGVILVASVDWETVQNNNGTTFYTNDEKGLIGLYCLLGGVPVLITGIILERIGNKKVKDYTKKLYRMNVGFDYTPQYRGVTLTYRF